MTKIKLSKIALMLISVLLVATIFVACGEVGEQTGDTKPQNQASYTLTIDGGHIVLDSGAVTSGSFKAGTKLNVQADVPSGKKFVKWVNQYDAEVSALSAFEYAVRAQANQMLKAVFEDKNSGDGEDGGELPPQVEYTLTVEGGFVTGTLLTTKTYQDGALASVTASVPSDKNFVGWQIGNDTVSTQTTYQFEITNDTTITALFTDKEKFVLTVEGGYIFSSTTTSQASFVSGTQVSVTAVVPNDKIFEGWQIGGITVSTNETYQFSLTQNTTVTAILRDVEKYTLTVVNGTVSGTALTQKTYLEGEIASVTVEVPSDKIFDGWKIGEEIVSRLSTYQFEMEDDVTITAVLRDIPRYTVTVVNGTITGTEFSTKEYLVGETASVTVEVPSDKIFDGWKIDEEIVSTQLTYQFEVEDDVTVTAVLRDIPRYTLTVVNGTITGTALTSQEYLAGTTVSVTTEIESDQIFDGWKIGSDIVSTQLTYQFEIAEETTITAVIRDIPRYTVTVVNGTITGTEFSTKEYLVGETASVTVEVPSDKTFEGWQIDGDTVSLNLTYEFEVEEDVTVTAVLRDIPRYTLTVVNGTITGTNLTSNEYLVGESVSVTVEVPNTKIFEGWKIGENVVSLSLTYQFAIDTDTTITAVLKDKPVYQVSVVGGTSSKDEVLQGESVTVTAEQDTDRKVFKNWEIDGQNVSVLREYTFTPTNAVTITAVYETRQKIEIYADGQLCSQPIYFALNGEYSAEAPKIEGKSFAGWSFEQNGEIVSYSKIYTVTITSDTTLWAHYDNVEEGKALFDISGGTAYLNYADGIYSNEKVAPYTFSNGEVVYVKPYVDGAQVTVSYERDLEPQVLSEADGYKYVAVVGHGEISIVCETACVLTATNAENESGEAITTINAQYGDSHTLYAQQIANKRFSHWTVNGERKDGVNVGNRVAIQIEMTGDMQVVAHYNDLYQVSVVGGISTASEAILGEIVTLTANQDTARSVFSHWAIDGESVSSERVCQHTVSGTVEIVAVFDTRYEVKVYVDGALDDTQYVVGGQNFTATSKTVENKAFVGWSTTQNGNIVSTDANYQVTITADTTLWAQYKNVYTVTVTGGTTSSINVVEGNQVTVTANADSDRSVFNHWEIGGKNVSSNKEYTFAVTKNIQIVAIFDTRYQVKVYVDGTLDDTQFVVDGQKYTAVSTTVANKQFAGWAESENGDIVSTDANYQVAVTQDTTLWAQYKNVYTVTVTGGTASASNVVDGNQVTVTANADTLRSVFSHWAIDGESVSTDRQHTFTVTSNVEIEAVYTIKYEVKTYVDGALSDTQYLANGEKYTAQSTVVANKQFAGWSTSQNGEIVSTDASYQVTITADTTLWARYKNIYTVTVTGGTASASTVLDGESVTVTANADSSTSVFRHWAIDGESVSTDKQYTFVVTQNVEIEAVFTTKYKVEAYIDGVLSDTQYISSGENYTATSTTVANKQFVGWSTTQNGNIVSTDANYQVTITQDTTLWAQYKNVYTVTVTGGTASSINVVDGNQVTVTANADSDRSGFSHWEIDGQNVSSLKEYSFTVTQNVEITAVFDTKYQVSVYIDGVLSEEQTQFVVSGKQFTATATEIVGKQFVDWGYTQQKAGISTDVNYTFIVERDVTLYARYANVYTVTVTGGTASASTVLDGESVTVTANADSNTSVFSHWAIDGENVSTDKQYTFAVTQNVEIEAVFTTKYKVEKYIDGVLDDTQYVASGENYTATSTTVANKQFVGWSTTQNGNIVSTDANYQVTVTQDTTLWAQYKNVYTVTVTGGSATKTQVVDGEQVTLNANEDTQRSGFSHWEIDGQNVSNNRTYSFSVTANVQAVAVFNQYYLVTLTNGAFGECNFANGTSAQGSTSGYFASGTQISLVGTLGEGQEVVGWYDGASEIAATQNATYTVSASDKTLEFKVLNLLKVTVTNNNNEYNYYHSGDNATVEVSVADNQLFDYWEVDGVSVSTSNPYTFTVTKDTVLTAHIVAKRTITVVNRSGLGTKNDVETAQVKDGSVYTVTFDSTTNFRAEKFAGWYVGNTLKTDATSYTFNVSADTMVEAKFDMIFTQDERIGWAQSVTNLKNYSDYYNDGTYGFVMPGLNENFIIQGVEYSASLNWAFVSGYFHKNAKMKSKVDGAYVETGITNSVILVVDMNQTVTSSNGTVYNGKFIKELVLQNADGSSYTGHAGGIAVTEKNIFVANSESGSVARLSLDTVTNSKSTAFVKFEELVYVPNNASYCAFADGILWVGEFQYSTSYTTDHEVDDIQKAWTCGYILNETGASGYNATNGFKTSALQSGTTPATPDYILWHGQKIQGMTVAGNKIVLSQSYGRTNASYLYTFTKEYNDTSTNDGSETVNGVSVPYWILDITDEYSGGILGFGANKNGYQAKIGAATMSEDLSVVKDGSNYYVLVANESPAYYYNGYNQDSMSKHPTDIIWKYKVEQ